MESPFIMALFIIILTIIIKIIDTNLDIITTNNLKIIEISNKINSISEKIKSSVNVSEDVDDIYAAIKAINNEIMYIKNKVF